MNSEEEVVTFKQFADFKQLDLIIKLTCFRLEEDGDYMPVLPQKRYVMSGNKKTGDELQSELVEYMRDLLKMEKIQRMLYVRLFLCMNAYPEITSETFNEVGQFSNGMNASGHNNNAPDGGINNFSGQPNILNANLLDTPTSAHAGIAAI